MIITKFSIQLEFKLYCVHFNYANKINTNIVILSIIDDFKEFIIGVLKYIFNPTKPS